MRREPILDSTTIASVGYDPKRHELEIEFHDSGDVYRYFEVPADEYAALLAAPSRGAYFNLIFKPREYRYQRIRTATRNPDRTAIATRRQFNLDSRRVSI